MGGKGGSDPNVEYAQSPEQRQISQMMMPILGQMYGWEPSGGGGNIGSTGGGGGKGSLFKDAIQQEFGMGGYEYTGAPWEAPAYDQPTADWYSNLSPDIMGGLQQPYIEAQQQGMELLGGSAGSARGGATGAAGAMTGDIMGQMARNVPMQAWQMGAQGRASEYQSQMLPYTGALAGISGTYPNPVVNPGDSSGGAGGAFGGAAGGAAMGSALGLSNPWTAGMMGLGALLGAK